MSKIILLICSFLFINQSFANSLFELVEKAEEKIAKEVVEEVEKIENIIEKRNVAPIPTNPGEFVTDFVNKTLEIIHIPNIKDDQINAKSRPLMDRYVDTEAITRFSIGPKYRELTPEQRKNVLVYFRNLLASRFSLSLKAALNKYKSVNVRFVVNEVRVVEQDRRYIINSTMYVNNDVIKVNWSVFVVSGALKILSMSISGIDLGQVLRDEIRGSINQLGFNGFLQDLKTNYGN